MDAAWMIDRLTSYLDLIDRYDLMPTSYVDKGKTMREILGREHETREIIHAAGIPLPGQRLFNQSSRASLATAIGRTLAVEARGYLEVKDELATRLAPTAPTLNADTLHPWVWGAAQSIWETGQYAVAVAQAATGVATHVKALVGRFDLQDTDLMTQCFSEKPLDPGKPRLRWPGDDNDRTVISIRSGLRQFAPGCFLLLRNPSTHRPDDAMTEHEGLEHLAALSLLARHIEHCEVVRYTDDT